MTTTALEKAAHLKAQAIETAKAEDRSRVLAAIVAFTMANSDVVGWIDLNADSNEFAASLARQLDERGTLTERQIAAVRAKSVAPATKSAPVLVDVGRIIESFERARSRGIEKPTMRLDVFKFKFAGTTGSNPGAIYVTEGELYLGKITGGQFVKSRECTADQAARIVAAASDPEKSAEAYGRLTGRCSICALKLTAAESIERTIGPICFEKYFG